MACECSDNGEGCNCPVSDSSDDETSFGKYTIAKAGIKSGLQQQLSISDQFRHSPVLSRFTGRQSVSLLPINRSLTSTSRISSRTVVVWPSSSSTGGTVVVWPSSSSDESVGPPVVPFSSTSSEVDTTPPVTCCECPEVCPGSSPRLELSKNPGDAAGVKLAALPTGPAWIFSARAFIVDIETMAATITPGVCKCPEDHGRIGWVQVFHEYALDVFAREVDTQKCSWGPLQEHGRMVRLTSDRVDVAETMPGQTGPGCPWYSANAVKQITDCKTCVKPQVVDPMRWSLDYKRHSKPGWEYVVCRLIVSCRFTDYLVYECEDKKCGKTGKPLLLLLGALQNNRFDWEFTYGPGVVNEGWFGPPCLHQGYGYEDRLVPGIWVDYGCSEICCTTGPFDCNCQPETMNQWLDKNRNNLTPGGGVCG